MATHLTQDSMKWESLREMLEVSEYCINFDKTNKWGISGCYGYPAAILLLSITDSIGAHIKNGGHDTKIHFQILNDIEWYNLNLSEHQIEILRSGYRNKLMHQAIINQGLILSLGSDADPVVIQNDKFVLLNLKPFYLVTKKVVDKFISTLKVKLWI
jgi:hypothetical protein